MQIKQIKDHSFFTNTTFPEFVKDSILEPKYAEIGITFDPAMISFEFVRSIENKDHVTFACYDEDKVIGILLGAKTKIIFSTTPIVEQRYVRIDEAYRGRGIYNKLLAELYKWGKANDCKAMVVGMHVHVSEDDITEIYKDKGFKPFHSNYYILI